MAAPIPTIQRATTVYTSLDTPFQLGQATRSYEQQYAQLYFYRLVQMRPILEEAAKKKWPTGRVIRILDIPDSGEEVVVVGTLYKEMALKPSILDEYTKERALAEQLGRTKFTQSDDSVVLEDEGARVTLTGEALLPGDVVTGVLAALKGSVLPSGEFDVKELCFAGIPPQHRRQEGATEEEEDKYVALVSGLGLGGDGGDASSHPPTNALQVQLLMDYCSGALGGAAEQRVAAKIVRVVVAGGLLRGATALSQPTAYASLRQQTTALSPIREADIRLTELASSLPVDVMPGVADPANYSLPQQPLHRCLFPGSTSYPTFTRSPNPHAFDLDGVRFLGTSGQNVDDILRFSDLDDSCEILQRLLTWRHLIPTAPDTLASYPYNDCDPFILEEAPHVLFAGGQAAFGTAWVEGEEGQKVRVVSVPEFSKTGTMVLVNIRTLEVQPISFEATSLFGGGGGGMDVE